MAFTALLLAIVFVSRRKTQSPPPDSPTITPARLRSPPALQKRQDSMVWTDYDVVVDLPMLTRIDYPIYARDRATLQAFEGGFLGKSVVAWGPYNVGKTFILGRIFGVVFHSESLTERTKALSYKRFEYGTSGNRYFVVIDCAGNSTPTNAEEEKVLLDKFATEKFLHEFAYLSSDFILLVFDCGSWDNTQKILYHRRRAYKNKEQKEIFIIFNWKLAKTNRTIEQLVKEEVVSTYLTSGTLQYDDLNYPDFFHLPRNPTKELASANIFWFGDDREPESHAHNSRAAQRVFEKIKNIEVFKKVEPLQVLYRELGVGYAHPSITLAQAPMPAPSSSAASVFSSSSPPPYQALINAEEGPSSAAAPAAAPSSGDLAESTPSTSVQNSQPRPRRPSNPRGGVTQQQQLPLLYACYEEMPPIVEVQEVQPVVDAEQPAQRQRGFGGFLSQSKQPEIATKLAVMKRVVCQGEQKMRGELRFERDHLRFTEFDIDPEIFVSCASESNQPLVKVYMFSFPGLKPMPKIRSTNSEPHSSASSSVSSPVITTRGLSPLSSSSSSSSSGASSSLGISDSNTFMLKTLKKGYAFEVQANRGVPFDGLGMTSQNSMNLVSNNTSSGYFDLGAEYIFKFADFLRGVLFVWVVRVDEQGNAVDEAQQQLECLRISHLTAHGLVLDSIPEKLLNEFK